MKKISTGNIAVPELTAFTSAEPGETDQIKPHSLEHAEKSLLIDSDMLEPERKRSRDATKKKKKEGQKSKSLKPYGGSKVGSEERTVNFYTFNSSPGNFRLRHTRRLLACLVLLWH